MKTILSILALSLLLATTTSCTSYHRHPVATVAALSVIGASSVGICAGIGDCGGEYGDHWQNNFARYGGTQLSVIAIIVASGVIAWADGDTWHEQPKTPASMLAYRIARAVDRGIFDCPVGLRYHDNVPWHVENEQDICVDPLGLTWSMSAWNSAGARLTYAQLTDPSRLSGDCGGEGFPDCASK